MIRIAFRCQVAGRRWRVARSKETFHEPAAPFPVEHRRPRLSQSARGPDRRGACPPLDRSFVVYTTTCYLLPATLYPSGYVNDTLAFVTPNGNCIAVFGDIT